MLVQLTSSKCTKIQEITIYYPPTPTPCLKTSTPLSHNTSYVIRTMVYTAR